MGSFPLPGVWVAVYPAHPAVSISPLRGRCILHAPARPAVMIYSRHEDPWISLREGDRGNLARICAICEGRVLSLLNLCLLYVDAGQYVNVPSLACSTRVHMHGSPVPANRACPPPQAGPFPPSPFPPSPSPSSLLPYTTATPGQKIHTGYPSDDI